MKTVLLNPFEKFSERTLILFGFISNLIGGYLGFLLNVRFDGVLDIHFAGKIKLYESFIDITIDILCITALLYIVGKLINSKTRFIDILSAIMIARIPLYFITFFNANNLMYTISHRMLYTIKSEKIDTFPLPDLLVILVFALISILFLVWFIILLYNGFKTATNAKETKHTLLFIVALIFSEVLSKILIYSLNIKLW